jgi:hypothetical protein
VRRGLTIGCIGEAACRCCSLKRCHAHHKASAHVAQQREDVILPLCAYKHLLLYKRSALHFNFTASAPLLLDGNSTGLCACQFQLYLRISGWLTAAGNKHTFTSGMCSRQRASVRVGLHCEAASAVPASPNCQQHTFHFSGSLRRARVPNPHCAAVAPAPAVSSNPAPAASSDPLQDL